MNINNHNENLTNTRPSGPRRLFSLLIVLILVAVLPVTALAADEGNGAIAAANSLLATVFALVRVVGVLAGLFGLVQLAMSIQSHDSSQRTSGILSLIGGLLFAFAPEILASMGISVT